MLCLFSGAPVNGIGGGSVAGPGQVVSGAVAICEAPVWPGGLGTSGAAAVSLTRSSSEDATAVLLGSDTAAVAAAAASSFGRAVQVKPMKPVMKAPGTNRLNMMNCFQFVLSISTRAATLRVCVWFRRCRRRCRRRLCGTGFHSSTSQLNLSRFISAPLNKRPTVRLHLTKGAYVEPKAVRM